MAIQNIYTSGVTNVPVVFDNLLLNVVAAPSSATQLNNLVTEYVNTNLSSERNFSFTTARDGWIYTRLDATPSGGGTAMLTLDGNPDTILTVTSTTAVPEAMRYVPAGLHSVRITQTGTVTMNHFIARSIPEIIYYYLTTTPTLTMEDRKYADLTSNGFLANYNEIVSDPDSSLSTYSANIADWRAQGKKWLSRVGMPGSADVTSAWITPMQNPLNDGIMADEFNSRSTANQTGYYTVWSDAIQNFPLNPALKGKQFYGFFSLFLPKTDQNPAFYALLLNALSSAGYRAVPEDYVWTQTDILTSGTQMSDWKASIADMQKKSVVFLGPCDLPPTISYQRAPDQNYKNLIQAQFQDLATNPVYAGLAGVGFYRAHYMTNDMLRWYTKLVRHYLIEGSQVPMGSDPDTLNYVINAGFESGLSAWTVQNAETGSIRIVNPTFTHGSTNSLPEGIQVLSTVRSGTAPNKMVQTLQGLTVGRNYRVNVYSMDQNLTGEIIGGSVTIQGATVLSSDKKSLTSSAVSGTVAVSGTFVTTGTNKIFYWTRHHSVFNATGTTAQITLSDWNSDTVPGGPVGEEVFWDFVDVAPDYSLAPLN